MESVTNDTTTTYVWGLRYVDDLVCREKNDEKMFALQDANWNVVCVTDKNGEAKERYVYDGFGQRRIMLNSGIDFDRAFTGQVLDTETGLMLYRNRYYSTKLGRFITRDPIGYDAGDQNMYRYVGNRAASINTLLMRVVYVNAVYDTPLLPTQTNAKNDGTANTINCQGGKLKVHLGSPGLDSACSTVHKEVHMADWIAHYGKDVCKGVPDGYLPVGGPGYADMLKKSECSAYKAGKQCRTDALGECPSEDEKKALEAGIQRDDGHIATNCASKT